MVHCEGVALKAFVSLINRRNDGCLRREPLQQSLGSLLLSFCIMLSVMLKSCSKEPELRELYDLVVQYWPPKPRKKKGQAEQKDDGEDQKEGEEELVEEGGQEGEEEEEKECDEEVDVLPGEGGQEVGPELPEDSIGGPTTDLSLLRRMGLHPCSPEPPSAYVAAAATVPSSPPEPSMVEDMLAAAPPVDEPEARLAYLELSV